MLLFDLIGVFAFAAYGACKAVDVRMDIFGVFVAAALTALGGGTIRELILDGSPIYLRDYRYIAVVLIGVAFSVCVHRHFEHIKAYLLVLDAVGLVAFGYIGAQRAYESGYGLGGMVLCAVLTAVGGGVLSDLVVGRVPRLFYGDSSAVPPLLLAILYDLLAHRFEPTVIIPTIVGAVFAFRLGTLYLRWQIWRPGHRAKADPAPAGPVPALPPEPPTWDDSTAVLPAVARPQAGNDPSVPCSRAALPVLAGRGRKIQPRPADDHRVPVATHERPRSAPGFDAVRGLGRHIP